MTERDGDSGVSGTIVETIQVPGYTYLRLKNEQGEVWAAVESNASLRAGQSVTVKQPTLMKAFRSKTLGRTFDSIYFGSLGSSSGASAATALPPGHPPVAEQGQQPAAPTATATSVAIASGKNAARVQDLYSPNPWRDGARVRVRGVVVKKTEGVLGFTYAHLRDGSGDEKRGDHDLTVTTKQPLKLGDIVTLEGTLRRNVNVGSGYEYRVLLEDAVTPDS